MDNKLHSIEALDSLPPGASEYSLGTVSPDTGDKAQEEGKKKDDAPDMMEVLHTGQPRLTSYVQNQFQKYPHSVKFVRTWARVYDMGDSEHVEEYSELLTQFNNPDHGCNAGRELTKFDKNTGNWKVFQVVDEYHFLPLFPRDPNSTNHTNV